MRHLFPLLLAAYSILLGLFMLAFLPKATAFYIELQKVGKLTADEARQKRKNILAGGVLAIALGVIMLLMVALRS